MMSVVIWRSAEPFIKSPLAADDVLNGESGARPLTTITVQMIPARALNCTVLSLHDIIREESADLSWISRCLWSLADMDLQLPYEFLS